MSTIPKDPTDTFYRGKVKVSVKSSTMQPSTVVRSHSELSHVLIENMRDCDTVGFMLTDGGPEHNVKFQSVQIALVIMWMILGLDMLIVGRSCPQNSWTNEIERVMAIINLALYGMGFSRSKMVTDGPQGLATSSASSSAPLLLEIQATAKKKAQDVLEHQWTSAQSLTILRERLSKDPILRDAALASIGKVCEDISRRIDNQLWNGEPIGRGCIADDDMMREFVNRICKLDPSLGEHLVGKSKDSDVFSSKLMKEKFANKDGINDFLKTHCELCEYSFQVMAVCWKKWALNEIAAGRNPDLHIGEEHPTCPFNCKRPTQPLSKFALRNFMACPDKADSDNGETAPYLSYAEAQSLVDNGRANAGNKFIPTVLMKNIAGKEKWTIAPVNTKGVILFFKSNHGFIRF